MTEQKSLSERCRDAANNKALSIGEAWNILEEAADALDGLEAEAKRVNLDAALSMEHYAARLEQERLQERHFNGMDRHWHIGPFQIDEPIRELPARLVIRFAILYGFLRGLFG